MKNRKRDVWGYVFLLPWFLFFAVFTVYPFVYGFGISLTDFSFMGSRFVGLDNFKAIFQDSIFSKSLWATARFAAIILPCSLVCSIWIAKTIQDRGPRFNAFVKAVFYIPSIVSQVALVIVWKYMFAPTFGLIASFSQMIGLPPISWFDNSNLSIPLLSLFVVIFSLGQPVILYSAAMGNIPISYYEAADIDGATRNQMFFKITLPLLHPTTTFILITSTIGVLQIFAVPYLMTVGGPSNETSSLLLMIYKSAFLHGKFGYASAIGVVLFFITALVAALQFRAMRRDTVEY